MKSTTAFVTICGLGFLLMLLAMIITRSAWCMWSIILVGIVADDVTNGKYNDRD
jgi:hypothetical protein